MIFFAILFVLFCLAGFSVAGAVWLLRRLFSAGGESWSLRKRLGALAVGVAIIAAPFLAYERWEAGAVLARVPRPLDVAAVEYRQESPGGFGLPGDNETGFVVYRLTDASTRWAQSKGHRLGEFLPGGCQRWHPTPVSDSNSEQGWYTDEAGRALAPRRANIAEYLDQYGFGIPIEMGRVAEVNHAIQTGGAFYCYGRGGSVTIIDAERGKVYFAYAG